MFRAQSNLGLAYYQNGALDSALIVYQRAIELNPNYSKTWNNLGLVYEGLGQYPRAAAAYAKALTLRADLAGTYGNLGRLLASRVVAGGGFGARCGRSSRRGHRSV